VKAGRPSVTAERVALRRAAHQLLDRPTVFDDPVALRVVDRSADEITADPREQGPIGTHLRASMAARSRFTEDALAAAVEAGVRQYVVLGAGLDTFAYRNPYARGRLRVFEVDHPATQAWKREQLARAGIELPPDLTFAPVDFETQRLEDGLAAAGWDPRVPTFFSWLGVTPYLTQEGIATTLRVIAAAAPGSAVVFDYAVARELLDPARRRVYDALAARVAESGEPWLTGFDPAALVRELHGLGFTGVEDVGPDAINARYFADRADGLRVGSLSRLMHARV
jgi:methyltransferase (TIGR00027 family)